MKEAVVNPRRVRRLKKGAGKGGAIVYWMSRDQRVDDNWALLFARELALSARSQLVVTFCLVPEFLGATTRQYEFMIEGLQEIERSLKSKRIEFHLLTGDPAKAIPTAVKDLDAGTVVCDFDPLKLKRRWKSALEKALDADFYEVDAHNIVPCWEASQKQEYGAYTIRPKIHNKLPQFMDEFPPLHAMRPGSADANHTVDWNKARKTLSAYRAVGDAPGLKAGAGAAADTLAQFINNKLAGYATDANDPTKDAQSGLSPYLHFGHISAQRVALEVLNADAPQQAKEAFLEEMIVRRELSDNFCFYNAHYDSFESFPAWAQQTLNAHRSDPRTYIYTPRQLERAQTHDELWNAAQMEMVNGGKMHGYMRMYWAKKILEWTRTPEEALRTAIRLNDRYEQDGRDPNGYTGIAWSIGGVHDRAWKERNVFGKIRYISYEGCKRKFDVEEYVRTMKAGPAVRS